MFGKVDLQNIVLLLYLDSNFLQPATPYPSNIPKVSGSFNWNIFPTWLKQKNISVYFAFATTIYISCSTELVMIPLLAIIDKYGVQINQWAWWYQALLEVSMNRIALWTRMHSSRSRLIAYPMHANHAAPSLQPCMPPSNHAAPRNHACILATMHACPLPTMHAPLATMHAPSNPATMHTPWQPCMPPLPTMHAPTNMHAPWQPCMPPSNHTCPCQPCMPPCNHAHPQQPCMPPLPTMHASLATMHAPWQPCMLPCEQNDKQV